MEEKGVSLYMNFKSVHLFNKYFATLDLGHSSEWE